MRKGTGVTFYKLIIYFLDQNSSSVFYSSSFLAAHYNIKNWKYQIVLNPHVTRLSNKDFKSKKIIVININDDCMRSISAQMALHCLRLAR